MDEGCCTRGSVPEATDPGPRRVSPMEEPLEELSKTGRAGASRRREELIARLDRLRAAGAFPSGARHLWGDAFALVLLASLHAASRDERFLDEARHLVRRVEPRFVGEAGPRGAASAGRAPEPFHLATWIFALGRLGHHEPEFRERAIELARAVHGRFRVVDPDARRTDHGAVGSSHGLGALAPFSAYVAYRSLEAPELSEELADARELVERGYRDLVITRDLALGMMLWLAHFHPDEPWAELHRGRCLRILEHLWVDPPGCFCREPGSPTEGSAAANHGISIGLQAVGAMPERIASLRRHSRARFLRDEDPAFAELLACCADLPGELLRAKA